MNTVLENCKKLADSIYYIHAATNIGIIEDYNKTASNSRKDIYIIDSGVDGEAGKYIFDTLEKLYPENKGGFNLKAVINTHSHSDHIGGNAWLHEKTGCEIWASEGEAGSMINPFIQEAVAWGGNPLPEIKQLFNTAKKTLPSKIINENYVELLKNGGKIKFISLAGHYFDMIGVIAENNKNEKVLFAGDAFFPREHILKYWLPFLYDSGKFKKSLDKVCTVKALQYVPGHGNPCKDIEETIEMNKIAIISTEICILKILKKGYATHEELLKKVADMNNIKLKTAHFMLIGSTLKAHITHLYEEKKISYVIKNNRMLWYAI